MAFNFNWSPLTADAGFYTRAQDLLTAALNKSPKPPIIVDDIIVTELNLGSVPPELEILEIGDLAEDRFRGIFKMSYAGDAFLTLRTRVQANPLNTYLLTRPSFASPKPLAAAAGLTIPLQITLSDFRLSGFIILVFSKQKGITVVFRNDPLESLKVSSTFDSIPFVRDYLQKEIEGQLRILFMDELPAIIHRLSLRLWVPEYRDRAAEESNRAVMASLEGPGQDPLASPPLDPVDSLGHPLNPSEIASLSLDSGVEIHSLFSQKNLLRLAALTDSQRTLSLFTPSIQEVVYRAWTGSSEQGEGLPGLPALMSPALSRTHSHVGSLHSFGDNASTVSMQSRGSSSVHSFSGSGLSLGSGRHSKVHARKRKKRVVDLRRSKTTDDMESVSGESTYTETTTSAPTVFSSPANISDEKNDDPVTPPLSPQKSSQLPTIHERRRLSGSLSRQTGRALPRRGIPVDFISETAEASSSSAPVADVLEHQNAAARASDPDATPRSSVRQHVQASHPLEKRDTTAWAAPRPLPASMLPYLDTPPISGIVEQAWVRKMASEIARRIEEEKSSNQYGNFWEGHSREEMPPPAYGQ